MNNEMHYIYEVYRQSSFSKAAEKLFLSQPALSIAVRKVESTLKTQLFDRSSNPLTLTAAGKIYIQKIEMICQIEKDLLAELNDLSGLRTGALNIGGTSYLNSYILPPVVSSFMKKFPDITITMTEAPSGSLFELLQNGSIDITFSCAEIDPHKFTKSHAFYDNVLLAVPRNLIPTDLLSLAFSREDIVNKAYLSTSTMPIDLSLFSGIPFILLSPQNNLYQRTMEFFKSARITPRVVQRLEQMATAYHLCCQGIGAAFIGSLIVSPYSPPNILYFCIDSPLALRPFHAITRSNRYLSLATNEFTREVSDTYTFV